MRLIDADEYKGKCICNRTYCGVNKLIEVDAVPTAFDLESVIEQLEEKIANTSDTAIGIATRMAFGKSIEILKSATNTTNGG